jgi:hypothetical protein
MPITPKPLRITEFKPLRSCRGSLGCETPRSAIKGCESSIYVCHSAHSVLCFQRLINDFRLLSAVPALLSILRPEIAIEAN